MAAVKSGATPSPVVTLKVDYRTYSHAQGLIAIVYDVKVTKGSLVCCDHGAITHSGATSDNWMHVDKYKVVSIARIENQSHSPPNCMVCVTWFCLEIFNRRLA